MAANTVFLSNKNKENFKMINNDSNAKYDHDHDHICSASPLFGFYVFLGIIAAIGGLFLLLF